LRLACASLRPKFSEPRAGDQVLDVLQREDLASDAFAPHAVDLQPPGDVFEDLPTQVTLDPSPYRYSETPAAVRALRRTGAIRLRKRKAA
jgi:hypothetical protein